MTMITIAAPFIADSSDETPFLLLPSLHGEMKSKIQGFSEKFQKNNHHYANA